MANADRRARARQRANWPIRKHALSEAPLEDLKDSTTAEERIRMMWELTVQAWALAGLPIPDYSRDETPIRIVRLSESNEAP